MSWSRALTLFGCVSLLAACSDKADNPFSYNGSPGGGGHDLETEAEDTGDTDTTVDTSDTAKDTADTGEYTVPEGRVTTPAVLPTMRASRRSISRMSPAIPTRIRNSTSSWSTPVTQTSAMS